MDTEKIGNANGNGKAPKTPVVTPEVTAPKVLTAEDFLASVRLSVVYGGVDRIDPKDPYARHRWQYTVQYEDRRYTEDTWNGLAHAGYEAGPQDAAISKPTEELLALFARKWMPTETRTLHAKAPQLAWILAELQAAASVPKSFAAWAKMNGLDPDSRAAERRHEALKGAKKTLKTFFGAAFDAFLAADFAKASVK